MLYHMETRFVHRIKMLRTAGLKVPSPFDFPQKLPRTRPTAIYLVVQQVIANYSKHTSQWVRVLY